MKRHIWLLIYLLFIYLCFSLALGGPFINEWTYVREIFEKMVLNPFKGIYVLALLYFPFSSIIFMLIGIYVIYSNNSFKWLKTPKRRLVALGVAVFSLLILGWIIRTLLPDKDYDTFTMRILHNVAYEQLSFESMHLILVFLFCFVLPLAMLILVVIPYSKQKNLSSR